MNLLKYFVSRLFSRALNPVHTQKMAFEKIFKDLGAYKYEMDGFTFTYNKTVKKINWEDITQINVFKTDRFTEDRIEMEIIYGADILTTTEDIPGWFQFVIKLKEVFPTIPKDWDINIIKPPFAENYTTIYRKQ